MTLAACGDTKREFGKGAAGSGGSAGHANQASGGTGQGGRGQGESGEAGQGEGGDAGEGEAGQAGQGETGQGGTAQGGTAQGGTAQGGTAHAGQGGTGHAGGGSGGASGGASSGAGGKPSTAGTGGTAGGSAGAGPTNCTVCTPVTLASSPYFVALTVQAPLLYFVEVPTGDAGGARSKLMRLSTNGGTPESITLGQADSQLTGLLADGSYVYSVQYQIARTPAIGGTNFTVLDNSPSYLSGSQAIRTNSTHVFAIWGLSQQHVSRLPKAGGTLNGPAMSPLFDWLGFDVDEASVYVFTKSTVSRFPVAGTDGMDSTVVAVASANETFTQLVVAGESLVLGTSTRLATVQKTAGTPATLVQGAVVALVSDATTAYYFRANAGGGTTCSGGSALFSKPLSGGTELRLANETSGCPLELKQDSTALYWLSADRKAIRKAPKTPK